MWSFFAGLGISAAPISFSAGGRQYIALLVGWGAGGPYTGTSSLARHGWRYGSYPRRLLAFALEGKAVMPALFEPRPEMPPLDNPDLTIDTAATARGEFSFRPTCATCHGFAAISGGGAPDLRASPIAFDRKAFGALLKGGARIARRLEWRRPLWPVCR